MIIALLLAGVNFAAALSWGKDAAQRSLGKEDQLVLAPSPSASPQTGSHLPPPIYLETALSQLQELESKPLCQRTAASLLVNNCWLLDGKDDATIHTDSGHQIKDFVDAYAASLAICDLERAKFDIPRECVNFREPAMSKIVLQNSAHLHVTSEEIDGCLQSLVTSSTAWSTWLSYHDKASRFCEAARVDIEKSQNILVFRRMMKILHNLAEGTNQRMDQHWTKMDAKFEETIDRAGMLSTLLEGLNKGLLTHENLVANIAQALQSSAETINSGQADAEKLVDLIIKLDELVSVHQTSLEIVTQKTGADMINVDTKLMAVVESATSIFNHLDLSNRQAAELERKQDRMRQGMFELERISGNLSKAALEQTRLLGETQNTTTDILRTLDEAKMKADQSNVAADRTKTTVEETNTAMDKLSDKIARLHNIADMLSNFATWLAAIVAAFMVGRYGFMPGRCAIFIADVLLMPGRCILMAGRYLLRPHSGKKAQKRETKDSHPLLPSNALECPGAV